MSGIRAEPALRGVEHVTLCYDKGRYCGHPRQVGIYSFDGGAELVVGHNHAPSAYRAREDVRHEYGGYHSRAQQVLQRSTDGGLTWTDPAESVLYDEQTPIEERRRYLYAPGEARDQIDLSSPDAMLYFGRSYAGQEGADGLPRQVSYAVRSADRGRTWESVPSIVAPPPGHTHIRKDNHPPVRCADGTWLGAFTVVSAPRMTALYGSDDDGMTWEYLARITADPMAGGFPSYPGLILLPGGRLQCYFLTIDGERNAIHVTHSDDAGFTWSHPRPIVRWGESPWVGLRREAATAAPRGARGVFWRSPWPLLLRDGRIVVLFARRKPPCGMGLIVSEDNGETWSREAILRTDASGSDIGYPVAAELPDGSIFAAYYYMRDDGNGFGGTRHIAGSRFGIA